jgi:Major Facilitator Superfamily.
MNKEIEKNIVWLAIEGALITLVNNLVAQNNNLFALRLNANDFQIGLVTALPQFVGLMVLIPGALWTDRLVNKRRMLISSLLLLSLVYLCLGFAPQMGESKLIFFLTLIALSSAPMTVYNISWQAYFSDVMADESRNRALTLRTRGTFIIGIVTPLITGVMLSSVKSNAGKIKFHQGFIWVACILLILQIMSLKKISGGDVGVQKGLALSDLRNVLRALAGNRRFVGFAGVALFFYLTWHVDWTVYYLGQIHYLKMNEAWLSYVTVGGALMQLLTLDFWSRMNKKLGVRFTIILAGSGLGVCTIAMMTAVSLPVSTGRVVFLVLHLVGNITIGIVMLNILQCLLQVIPETNKTLSISVYTVLVTLSNAVMPMVGVWAYTALGGTAQAMKIFYLMVLALRIVAIALWAIRWRMLRMEPN